MSQPQPPRIRLNQHVYHPPPVSGGIPRVPPPSDTDLVGLGMPVDDPSLGAPVGTADPLADQLRHEANQQLQHADLEAEIERRATERARQMLQGRQAAAESFSIPADAIDPVPVTPVRQPQQLQAPPSPQRQDIMEANGNRFRNVGVPDQIDEGLVLRSKTVTEITNVDVTSGTVDTFTNVPEAHQNINGSVGFAFVSNPMGRTEVQQDEVNGRDEDTMLFTNEVQMERRLDPRDGNRLTFN